MKHQQIQTEIIETEHKHVQAGSSAKQQGLSQYCAGPTLELVPRSQASTPSFCRLQYATKAGSGGIHYYCEYPVGFTLISLLSASNNWNGD